MMVKCMKHCNQVMKKCTLCKNGEKRSVCSSASCYCCARLILFPLVQVLLIRTLWPRRLQTGARAREPRPCSIYIPLGAKRGKCALSLREILFAESPAPGFDTTSTALANISTCYNLNAIISIAPAVLLTTSGWWTARDQIRVSQAACSRAASVSIKLFCPEPRRQYC